MRLRSVLVKYEELVENGLYSETVYKLVRIKLEDAEDQNVLSLNESNLVKPLHIVYDASSYFRTNISNFLWDGVMRFLEPETMLRLVCLNKDWNWEIKNCVISKWEILYQQKGWRLHKNSLSYYTDLVDRVHSKKSLLDVWKSLEEYMQRRIFWSLREGATEAQLIRFEDKIGFHLPLDLRSSLLLHDGQTNVAYVPSELPRFYTLVEIENILNDEPYIYDRRHDMNLTLIPTAKGIAVDVETGNVYQMLGYAGTPIFLHKTWARYLAIS